MIQDLKNIIKSEIFHFWLSQPDAWNTLDIDYEEPIYSLEHINGSLYKFKSESQYLNSVQPSIWKTDYLKKVCNNWLVYRYWEIRV